MDKYYSSLYKDESNIEHILNSLKSQSQQSFFRRFRVLLKAYELYGNYSYFKRAEKELEKIISLNENKILSSLYSSLSQVFLSKEFCSILSHTNPYEAIQSFYPELKNEWPGAYLLYLLYRMIGKEDDSFELLKKATILNKGLEEQLSEFMILRSYAGNFHSFSFDMALNMLEKSRSSFSSSVILHKDIITFVLPEPNLFYLASDFLEFSLLFYDLDFGLEELNEKIFKS